MIGSLLSDRDLSIHPVPSDEEIDKRGFCMRCKLHRLISTVTPGIIRVLCAESIDASGIKHGRVHSEFKRFPGMQYCDIFCDRFIEGGV